MIETEEIMYSWDLYDFENKTDLQKVLVGGLKRRKNDGTIERHGMSNGNRQDFMGES